MSISLSEINNLKIVPENYESATYFNIDEIKDDSIRITLSVATEKELNDYDKGIEIEAFGLSKEGLVYFLSSILDRENNTVTIKAPVELKSLQRRKYTRVPFMGKLKLLNDENVKITPDDLSAGGFKFSSDTKFIAGHEYTMRIELINNLAIDCIAAPIRVVEINNEDGLKYSISARFIKIRSIDRIALMQYSLRVKTEMENKG